jgi:hypothetical protein
MKLALRGLLCGAALLATSMFGSAGVNAQTVTINGCASLTSSGGSGNIIINCGPVKSGGAPSCSSLSVTPATNANNPSSITLTANCTAGTNPITSYTFSGTGVNTTPQSMASQSVAAPSASTTFSVTASDGSLSSTVLGSYTVGGAGPGTGSVDLSACTAQGFTGILMDLQYVAGAQTRLSSDKFGSFGNRNALVLRFTTPAVAGDTSSIQFSQLAGTDQVFRVATVATLPCQIATAPGASGSILTSNGVSQSPSFPLQIGGVSSLGRTALNPGTTYYITVVNRNGYKDTVGSCTKSSSCGVFMDLLN